ncbi:uncharacterized protein [Takifugu rubripes]|uniref:uncharacterized protein n=1 Tax=Takifugu rubripes TaxID=31033 RepID=UPI001145B608|nr:uncharacterized protein LOC115249645 [Takifugu rubripes]
METAQQTSQYPRWSEGGPDPLIGGSDGYQTGEPVRHLPGLPASQGGSVPPGFRYSPESPENPEDRGQIELHDQPTAVIPPMARPLSPGRSSPQLIISDEDRAHLSSFLSRPVEQYRRPEDLRPEIGGMPTRVYASLRIGLTRTARQQVQRIRRQAYMHNRERSLRSLQNERNTLNQQLDAARRTAIDLHNRLRRQQDANDRAQDTIIHLRQAHAVLMRFCNARLPRYNNALFGLNGYPRRGEERSSLRALPSYRPHSPEYRPSSPAYQPRSRREE